MNKALQEQVISILGKGQELAGNAINKLMAEAPELVKEVLWYNGIRSFAWFLLFTILFLVMVLYEKKVWKWGIKGIDEYEGASSFMAFIYSALNFICLLICFGCCTWLKILIAPRLYLLEYVSNLVK